MKPILFNTQMVRAIQDGRKTCTRRAVKPQPKGQMYPMPQGSCYPGCWGCAGTDAVVRAPYQPGDVLWVREAWANLRGMGFGYDQLTDKPWLYAYKADIVPGSDGDRARKDYGVEWRPSIHMPKEAARLFLRVTGVRAERLQEINDAGVVAEGLEIGCYFDDLWDRTIKPADRALYGWDADPWVWVVEFERISKAEASEGGGEK